MIEFSTMARLYFMAGYPAIAGPPPLEPMICKILIVLRTGKCNGRFGWGGGDYSLVRMGAGVKLSDGPVRHRSGRWPGSFVAGLALLAGIISGCSTAGDKSQEAGQYPVWLIAMAEPAAPAIGFVISRVQWRQGYLGANMGAVEYARKQLKPLDIILFSNKHRLSGHAGGGLFSHSAIYLGSEQELEALGLWRHRDIVPYHEAIRGGALFIEAAQKTGTVLASQDILGKTDRLVILRPRQLGTKRSREVLPDLFSKVGTPFDHRFRLEEGEGIFCTELIDQVMPELGLPRRNLYGRQIISPDDIARSAATGKAGLRIISYVAGFPHGWEVLERAELKQDLEAATMRP